MGEVIDEGTELAAMVEQTAPKATVPDLMLLRSSLIIIQQQGNISADKMLQYVETTRNIVQRKIVLVLENDL